MARTLGVEEEYFLVDLDTGKLNNVSSEVLGLTKNYPNIEHELLNSQVEISTPVSFSLAEVRSSLTGLRKKLSEKAGHFNTGVAAIGTYPGLVTDSFEMAEKPRYTKLSNKYGHILKELQICGCHVHVGVQDREEALEVAQRVQPWLSVLLALSSNSPFWRNESTNYQGYRNLVFGKCPTAGPLTGFKDWEQYDGLVEDLIRTGVILDKAMMYSDVRPSYKYNTVEIRIADVCTSVDNSVLIAGLARALVDTAVKEREQGLKMMVFPQLALQGANWKASKDGVGGGLVDLFTGEEIVAQEVIGSLIAYIRDSLEEFGDYEEVSYLVKKVMASGTDADKQLLTYSKDQKISSVLLDVVERSST